MIRFAGLQDFDRIMKLMINFANSAPITALHNPQYDHRRIQHLLAKLCANGCIIVGEDKSGTIQGMLIAGINEDPWLPHVKTLREMAWWVEPEYRNTSMGYRLLKKYVEVGEQMVDKGVIEGFTLTTMTISPDFDLSKRGWREIETNYVYEG